MIKSFLVSVLWENLTQIQTPCVRFLTRGHLALMMLDQALNSVLQKKGKAEIGLAMLGFPVGGRSIHTVLQLSPPLKESFSYLHKTASEEGPSLEPGDHTVF